VRLWRARQHCPVRSAPLPLEDVHGPVAVADEGGVAIDQRLVSVALTAEPLLVSTCVKAPLKVASSR